MNTLKVPQWRSLFRNEKGGTR